MNYPLALPRERTEALEINNIRNGLGKASPIGLQCVLASAPKPLCLEQRCAVGGGSCVLRRRCVVGGSCVLRRHLAYSRPANQSRFAAIVKNFVDSACVRDADSREKSADLWSAFQRWHASNSAESITRTAFGRGLNALGFVNKKSDAKFWVGLRIACREATRVRLAARPSFDT